MRNRKSQKSNIPLGSGDQGGVGSSYLTLTLDTHGPEVEIDAWSELDDHVYFDFSWDVNDFTEFKVWGELDPTGINHDLCGTTEFNAPWISPREFIDFTLGNSAIGAGHQVYFKFRDDVWNETLTPFLVSRNQTYLLDQFDAGQFKEFHSTFMVGDEFAEEDSSFVMSLGEIFDQTFYVEALRDEGLRPIYFYIQEPIKFTDSARFLIPPSEKHAAMEDAVTVLPARLNVKPVVLQWISGEFIYFDYFTGTEASDLILQLDENIIEQSDQIVTAAAKDMGTGLGVFSEFSFNVFDHKIVTESVPMLVHPVSDDALEVDYASLVIDSGYNVKSSIKPFLIEGILRREDSPVEDLLFIDPFVKDYIYLQDESFILPDVYEDIVGIEKLYPTYSISLKDIGRLDSLISEAVTVGDALFVTEDTIEAVCGRDTFSARDYWGGYSFNIFDSNILTREIVGQNVGVDEWSCVLDSSMLHVAFLDDPLVHEKFWNDADIYLADTSHFEELLVTNLAVEEKHDLVDSVAISFALVDKVVAHIPEITFEINLFDYLYGKEHIMFNLPTNEWFYAWNETPNILLDVKELGTIPNPNYIFEIYVKDYIYGAHTLTLFQPLTDEAVVIEQLFPMLAAHDTWESYEHGWNDADLYVSESAETVSEFIDFNVVVSDRFFDYGSAVLAFMGFDSGAEVQPGNVFEVNVYDFGLSGSSASNIIPIDEVSFIQESDVLSIFGDDTFDYNDTRITFEKIVQDWSQLVLDTSGLFVAVDDPVSETDSVVLDFVVFDKFDVQDKKSYIDADLYFHDSGSFGEASCFTIPLNDHFVSWEEAVIELDSFSVYYSLSNVNIRDIRPEPVVEFTVYDEGWGLDAFRDIEVFGYDESVSENEAIIRFLMWDGFNYHEDFRIINSFKAYDFVDSLDDFYGISIPIEMRYDVSDQTVICVFADETVLYSDLGKLTCLVPVKDQPEFVAETANVLIGTVEPVVSEDSVVISPFVRAEYVHSTDIQRLTELLLLRDFADVEEMLVTEMFSSDLLVESSEVVIVPVVLDESIGSDKFDGMTVIYKAVDTSAAKDGAGVTVAADDSVNLFEEIVVSPLTISESGVGSEYWKQTNVFTVYDDSISCYNTIIYDPTITEQRELLYWWEQGYPGGFQEDYYMEPDPLWGHDIPPGERGNTNPIPFYVSDEEELFEGDTSIGVHNTGLKQYYTIMKFPMGSSYNYFGVDSIVFYFNISSYDKRFTGYELSLYLTYNLAGTSGIVLSTVSQSYPRPGVSACSGVLPGGKFNLDDYVSDSATRDYYLVAKFSLDITDSIYHVGDSEVYWHANIYPYSFNQNYLYFCEPQRKHFTDGWFLLNDGVVPEDIPYKLYINMGCGLDTEYNRDPLNKMEKFIYEKKKHYFNLDIIAHHTGEDEPIVEQTVIVVDTLDHGTAIYHVDLWEYNTYRDSGIECENVVVYSPDITMERDLIYWWEAGYNDFGRSDSYAIQPNSNYGKSIEPYDLDYPYYSGDKEFGAIIPVFGSEAISLYPVDVLSETWYADRVALVNTFPAESTLTWVEDLWTPGVWYLEGTVRKNETLTVLTTSDNLFELVHHSLLVEDLYSADVPWDIQLVKLELSYVPVASGDINTVVLPCDLHLDSRSGSDVRRSTYILGPDKIDINAAEMFPGVNLTGKTFYVKLYFEYVWEGRFYDTISYNFQSSLYYSGKQYAVSEFYSRYRRPTIPVVTDEWFKPVDVLYYEATRYKLYINMGCDVNEAIDHPSMDRMERFVQDKMTKFIHLDIDYLLPGEHAVSDEVPVVSLFHTIDVHYADYVSYREFGVIDIAYPCEDILIYSETDFAQRDIVPWWFEDYPHLDNLHQNPKWLKPIEPGDIDYPYEYGDPKFGTVIEPYLVDGKIYTADISCVVQDELNDSNWRSSSYVYSGIGTPAYYDSGIVTVYEHDFVDEHTFNLNGVGFKILSCTVDLGPFGSQMEPYSHSTGNYDNGTTTNLSVYDDAQEFSISYRRSDGTWLNVITQPTYKKDTPITVELFDEDFIIPGWDDLSSDDFRFVITAEATDNSAQYTYTENTYNRIGISGWERSQKTTYKYYSCANITGKVRFQVIVKNPEYFAIRQRYITDPIDQEFITRDFYDDFFGFKFYVNLGCGPSPYAFPIVAEDNFHRWIYRKAQTGNFDREYRFVGDIAKDSEEPVIGIDIAAYYKAHFHWWFPKFEITVFEHVHHEDAYELFILGDESVSFKEDLEVTLSTGDVVDYRDLMIQYAEFPMRESGKLDINLLQNMPLSDAGSLLDGTVICLPSKDLGVVDYHIGFAQVITMHDAAESKYRNSINIPLDDISFMDMQAVTTIPFEVEYTAEEKAHKIEFIFVNDHGDSIFIETLFNPVQQLFYTYSDGVIIPARRVVYHAREWIRPDRIEVLREIGYVCKWVQIVSYPYVIDWLAGHFVDYYSDLMEADYLRFTTCFGMPPGNWPPIKPYPGTEILPPTYPDPTPVIPIWPTVPPYWPNDPDPWGHLIPGKSGGYIGIPVDSEIIYIPDPTDPPEPYVWKGGTSLFMMKFILDETGQHGFCVVDGFYFAVFNEDGERVSKVQFMTFTSYVGSDGNEYVGTSYGAMVFFGLEPNTTYYIRETDKRGNVLVTTIESEFTGNRYSMPRKELVCKTTEEGECAPAGVFYNMVEYINPEGGGSGGGGAGGGGGRLPGGNNYKPKLYPHGWGPGKPYGPDDSPFEPRPGHADGFDPKPIAPVADGRELPPIVPPDYPGPKKPESPEIPGPGYEGAILSRFDIADVRKSLVTTIPVDCLAYSWEYHYIPADFILELLGIHIETEDGFLFDFESPFKFDSSGVGFEFEEPFRFDSTEFSVELNTGFLFDEIPFVAEFEETFKFDEVIFEFECLVKEFDFELIDADGNQSEPTPEVIGEVLTYTGNPQELCHDLGDHGIIYYRLDEGEWSTVVPVATDTGFYTVEWYAMASPLYFGYGSKINPLSVTCMIERATPAFLIDNFNVLVSQPTTITFEYWGDGEVSCELVDTEFGTCDLISQTLIEKDRYRIEMLVTADEKATYGNIIISATNGKNFLPGKTTVMCTVNSGVIYFGVISMVVAYTGLPTVGQISVSGPTDYIIRYADEPITDETELHDTVDFFLDVGAYQVYFEISALGYETVYGKYRLTIEKAIQPIVIVPTTETYDSYDHALIQSVSGVFGTMWYSLDAENFFVDWPVATLPGTYVVYWYCVGDSNHYDDGLRTRPNSFQALIDKMELTGVIDPQTVDIRLGGILEVVIPTESDGAISVTASDSSYADFTLDGTLLTVHAYCEGEIYVYVRQEEGTFYKAHTFVFYLTIEDTRILYNVDPPSVVYTGEVIDIKAVTVTRPDESHCVIRYSKEPITPATELYPTPAFYVSAGVYTIYFLIGSYGYETVYDSYLLTIEQAPNFVDYDVLDIIYDGNLHKLMTVYPGYFGTVYYSFDRTYWSSFDPMRMAPGTYKLYWYCAGDGNHVSVGTYDEPNEIVAYIRKKALPTLVYDLSIPVDGGEYVFTVATPSDGRFDDVIFSNTDHIDPDQSYVEDGGVAHIVPVSVGTFTMLVHEKEGSIYTDGWITYYVSIY